MTRCNVSLERSQYKKLTPPQTTDLHGFLFRDTQTVVTKRLI